MTDNQPDVTIRESWKTKSMNKRGHEGMALLMLAPLTGMFGAIGVLISAGAFATCRLPDLDNRIDGISHRGWTHTVWFGILVAALVGLLVLISTVPIFGMPAWVIAVLVALAAYLGIISHLVADALTVGSERHAIRPFYPLSRQPFRFGVVHSNSRLWNVILLGTGMVAQLIGLVTWYGFIPI